MNTTLPDAAFDGVLEDLEGLDEHEIRDLVERSSQIQQMTLHPGWGYLQDYLIALTTSHQKRILSGGCRSIEDYRAETGFVRGLQASLEAVDKLQQRIARLRDRFDDVV